MQNRRSRNTNKTSTVLVIFLMTLSPCSDSQIRFWCRSLREKHYRVMLVLPCASRCWSVESNPHPEAHPRTLRTSPGLCRDLNVHLPGPHCLFVRAITLLSGTLSS